MPTRRLLIGAGLLGVLADFAFLTPIGEQRSCSRPDRLSCEKRIGLRSNHLAEATARGEASRRGFWFEPIVGLPSRETEYRLGAASNKIRLVGSFEFFDGLVI
jgi:hypothetical protein